jgi:hypothetical protein
MDELKNDNRLTKILQECRSNKSWHKNSFYNFSQSIKKFLFSKKKITKTNEPKAQLTVLKIQNNFLCSKPANMDKTFAKQLKSKIK